MRLRKPSGLLGGAAPGALDILTEIANALGNNPDFAASVSTALGLRVSVDAAQGFTAAQKKRGRDNIDALGHSDKGAAGGVAPLGDDSKIAAKYLPEMKYLPTAGGKISGPIEGVAVSGSQSSFWTTAEGGGYATSAGNADTVDGWHAQGFIDRIEDRSYWRTRDYMLAELVPVGGYALLEISFAENLGPGATVGGNALWWASVNGANVDGPSLVNYGTWRLCGRVFRGNDTGRSSLFQRIG